MTYSRFKLILNDKYLSICISIVALLIALSIPSGFADAESRNSDLIFNETVEACGLTASQAPNISAEYAYLISGDGEAFFNRSADDRVHIASITKIMTALVALDYGDPQTTEITVSQNAASIGESSAALKTGDVLTLEAALKALMIPSGNDAGQAIAESMGPTILEKLKEAGGNEADLPQNGYDAFIYAMNKKSQDLGMANSHFTNPHGLDFNQYSGDMYSSARDVSLMARAAMQNELFRSIVSTHETTISVKRGDATVDLPLQSTDILLGTYEGACGVKTGFTDIAGACFAGACERDGKMLYAIVLDSPSEAQRFVDCESLWNWVWDNTIDYPLAHSPVTTTYEQNGESVTVPVIAQVSHKGWEDKTFAATLENPDETVEVFRINGNVSQEVVVDDVSSDVHIGDKVGTVNYYQNNEIIKTVDLVAAEDCPAPNFIEGIGIWWDRLFKGFNGQATEAESEIVNTTPLIFGAQATV